MRLIGLVLFAALLAPAQHNPPLSGYGKTIAFSNYTWSVKTATSPVGPGPNYFSDSNQNVWVDTAGRLHLRIVRTRGKWYCAEVVLNGSLGYGAYRFYLDSAVDALDPNVVLGLFTWNDDPAYNNRELDIEFSRWGDRFNQNAQYVVQPYNVAGNLFRFTEPAGLAQTTHTFQWSSASVLFESWSGLSAAPGPVIAQHQFTSGTPPAGGENARMNLWLYQGKAPTDGKAVEVIVNRFEFSPL